MGARIKGAGTDVIRITGKPQLHGTTYTVIPDQIETGTLMIAAAATRLADTILRDARTMLPVSNWVPNRIL